MATMVKEKRREKKKTKEKHSARSSLPEVPEDEPSIDLAPSEVVSITTQIFENDFESSKAAEQTNISEVPFEASIQNKDYETQFKNLCGEQSTSSNEFVISEKSTEATEAITTTETACSKDLKTQKSDQNITDIDSFNNLNARLDRMAIPDQSSDFDEARALENLHAYLTSNLNLIQESQSSPEHTMMESPSAPMFEEETPQALPQQDIIADVKPKCECMPLDEAMRLYGGTEIAAVKDMSEREEATVEAGPISGPEHPLVDLLSTFRSSLRAVERDRSRLASNFDDEEKSRSTLWKIEKRKMCLSEECKCGLKVYMKATYEYAQLMKERLPVAKLKLELLLRDVQESYCHHQHAALLAHSQIEDIISETIKSNKNEIREALSLILQALRVSDGAPDALPAALQRWAEILAAALVDGRDLRQLLFVMHHLFRQSRSVRWAARVLSTRVHDSVSAARTLAVLDILLSKLHLEAAVECVEETEEAWEEVDIRGGGGAVSSGNLRERDLIALLRALPLQELIAKLVLFSQADFRQATEYEWGDASGGNALLKCCCGVRVLLSIVQRAITAHPAYDRLHGVLRGVACSALTALACLYRTPRAPYFKELEDKIIVELEAAFAAGFTLFGTHELHKLPTALLTDDTAKDYCIAFIFGLHDKSPKKIQSLSIEAPALSCGARVRIITQAAVDRDQDHELARIALDFLLQTGLKRKSVPCKAGCEPTARECLPELLTAHPYLRSLALHTVADLSQVETLEPSTVSVLQVNKWRPSVGELQAVLEDWSQRCPTLLQQMLLQLDFTPHTGLSLPMQLHLGGWLCVWSRRSAAHLEHAWRVLLRLRTHRACWQQSADAPPPDPVPTDTFSMAHAVLSSEWGHSIPLICSHGVSAILSVCATRPREAVHCLAPVMLLMPNSPESVSLTPKFAELFTALVSCGPSLVQRALGRGGASGAELLLRLVLSQVDMKQQGVLAVWLHALWKVPCALAVLDAAALCARDWRTLDAHAASLLQDRQNAKEYISNAVRFASTSPLLCECLLRAAHSREVNTHLFPALVTAICQQHAASQKIHVDNALQPVHRRMAPALVGVPTMAGAILRGTKINAKISSEELVIYRCASAALVAPFQHPSHLALWRLFFHMYLQRPPKLYHNSAPPGGPLFFSGLIKSRVLSQIKKRLLETATHHHNEAELYKNRSKNESKPESSNRVVRSESIIRDNRLFPALTIADLTGESRSESDSDSEGERVESVTIDGSTEEAIEVEKKRNSNMAAYHAGAEKMIREYSRWLEEGEKVKELPQHADIARFIHEQALEEAWKEALARCRPPPSAELDTFLRPEPAPPYSAELSRTPLNIALASILSVKCRSLLRSRRAPGARLDRIDDACFAYTPALLSRVDELLKDIQKYAQEWGTEVSRISSVDSRLWELVAALRVPRRLPPVRKQCTNKCNPITFDLNTHEWCLSEGAERGIRENRSASLAGIRRLTRPRPDIARTAAALHIIARKTRSAEHAVKVLELAWRCAGLCLPCTFAHTALTALFDQLAERWITHDGKLCQELLSKSCANNSTTLQQTLCGSLVAPRRMRADDWPAVYSTLLRANLPSHTVFSYLSRFEMVRWSETADAAQRHSVLQALLSAAQRCGPDPASDSVLVEIIGVHTAVLADAQELGWLLMESSQISTYGLLPPAYWRHLNRAAEALANEVIFDHLGNILRGLGNVWCKGRHEDCARHVVYAPYVAEMLCILIRAFVAAAVQLTYEPARVAWYAWSAMSEAWSPWVSHLSILPHPAVSNDYATMLNRLTDCVRQVMRDCPGTESRLLQEIFFWVISSCRSVQAKEQRPRPQVSVLLEQLSALPWCEHQWFNAPSAIRAVTVIFNGDEELIRWCCERFRNTKTETFLNELETTDMGLAHYLVLLLKLFTGNLHVNNPTFLKEGAMLPWWHLTEEALTDALNEFFSTHYDPALAYHDKPQTIVILHAGELEPRPQYSPSARLKRQRVVSQWTCACSLPALQAHRAAFTRYMLNHLTRLEPYLDKPEEPQDLLYRVSILTLSETSSLELPVWQHWISTTAPAAMIAPCVGVATQMTLLRLAAPLADDAIRAHLHTCEGGWSEIRRLWSRAVFKPRLYAERGALHAAYACSVAHARPGDARPELAALLALTEANAIDFIKNEVIVAVWICYAARVARECDAMCAADATSTAEATRTVDAAGAMNASSSTAALRAMVDTDYHTCKFAANGASSTSAADVEECKQSRSEIEECKHAARSLLAVWGQQPRRSILKVVTLQADSERTTARHRVLVRLAECILSPSPGATQAYKSACAGLPASADGDVTAWARLPRPPARTLPRLAVRLYRTVHERYFQWEMDHMPDE